ncbi:hypothetical protein ACFX14_027975 [Malus domestica]
MGSAPISKDDRVEDMMADLGSRFGLNLRLSEKERGCLRIDRKEVEGALLGFQHTMVAEVLTSKEVNGEVFADCFTSLWRGREGVSIRDIGERRFLVRFASIRDLQRVVDADQPWTFKNDLVMVADRTEKGLHRWDPLSLGTFWIQVHNVPVLSMTQAVAESIGGLIGTVRMVDKTGSRDCVGRFLRFEPLMRGTFVDFPDEGKTWIAFQYESLPNCCLICGLLGHPTRVCKDPQVEGMGDEKNAGDKEGLLAFRGLDAVTDLRGRPLNAGTRSRGSAGASGGHRASESRKDDCSEEHEGGRRSGRSSTASGMGNHSKYGTSIRQSGSQFTDKSVEEVIDTATSPSKPRWSTSKCGHGPTKLADKIRRQKLEEEEARKARELAFEAGQIGPGGFVADGVPNVVLNELLEQEGSPHKAKVPPGFEQDFDLNLAPLAAAGTDTAKLGNGEMAGEKERGAGESTSNKGVEDDPFVLDPIIAAVSLELKRQKRRYQEAVQTDCTQDGEARATKSRKCFCIEAEETSHKGSPNSQ